MKPEQQMKKIASLCGFDFPSIQNKAKLLEHILEESGVPNSPILIGFDINGPLVSTQDASMTPYKGTPEALEFLALLDGVHICIVTGWDLNTARYLVEEMLKLKGTSIVSEKGMVYQINGKVNHLYPNSEKEIAKFAEALFSFSENHELQIAIQPNESSGCQCVYFEGFRRGNLGEHPLNKKRPISSEYLLQFLKKREIRYNTIEDTICIQGTSLELYKLFRCDLPLFPVRLLKTMKKDHNTWILRVDQDDNENFKWEQLLDIGHELSVMTGRKPDPNNDFCIDFSTSLAEKGAFSKNKAIHIVGRQKFKSTFSIFNVGDKPDDKVEGKNTVFFPQENTAAINVKANVAFSVVDGREYALIVSMLVLNQKRSAHK